MAGFGSAGCRGCWVPGLRVCVSDPPSSTSTVMVGLGAAGCRACWFVSPIKPPAAPAPPQRGLELLSARLPCVFVSPIWPPAAPAPRWRGLGLLRPDRRHKHTELPSGFAALALELLGFAAPAREPSGFAPRLGAYIYKLTAIFIALHHIANVEKLTITSLGCSLILSGKNFQVAHFVLDSDTVCHEVYISLLKLSQPVSLIILCFHVYLPLHVYLPEDLYAFSYTPKSSKEMRENGWKLIDPISDFRHMGIPSRYGPDMGVWSSTITDANRNYELNALANRAAGKGYENENNYANIRFRFMVIENIHVMRSSLQKLLEGGEFNLETGSSTTRYDMH
ncbi:Myotubularin-related protein 8 [Myotis brandtii]|uniref:Myotubularin-related protein 8 n=1 Tax=Myotis brandtii TaxID=109478 RepID=S7NK74_MYOBR|nr:Myotubularin-related protein 8 [Myotis brandtii]